MREIFRYQINVLLILIITGCSTTNTTYPSKISILYEKSQDKVVSEYVFQEGDVFDVKFFEYSEFDQNLTVRPDGKISLPLVEDLLIVGMTPSLLDKQITEKYSEKIKNPEVTIVLRQFAEQKIYVGGEVNNPGTIQLKGQMTLLQSIFHAGGFKRSANLQSVILIRNNDNKPEAHRIDADRILKEGDPDISLNPSDVVYLPKTYIAEVNDFVDQYINKIVPDFARLNFQYLLNSTNSIN